MVVYFDPRVCKYCLMQNERYPLNCCRDFADRHEDIYAACEQLMPEGDVIYGDVKISIHAPARGATSFFTKKFSSLLAKIV